MQEGGLPRERPDFELHRRTPAGPDGRARDDHLIADAWPARKAAEAAVRLIVEDDRVAHEGATAFRALNYRRGRRAIHTWKVRTRRVRPDAQNWLRSGKRPSV